jgi:CRP/FNR family cyclic AMP-dependent transcriptional regulator
METTWSVGNPSSEKHNFDLTLFLNSGQVASKVVKYQRLEKVYSQGDPATDVIYIQKGELKLFTVNELHKKAIVAVLGPNDFFGAGCLAFQSVRKETATALTPASVLVINKSEMIRIFHIERSFSDRFITHMLARNARIEGDLIDQLLNVSERRLARTLLMLARYGTQDQAPKVPFNLSHEMLAEMIGTTRSRVSFFMNKFRKLGFIDYDNGLRINPSLVNFVLLEESPNFMQERISNPLPGAQRLGFPTTSDRD